MRNAPKGGSLETFCQRCSSRMLMPLPISISSLAAFTEGFIAMHRDCKAQENNVSGRTP